MSADAIKAVVFDIGRVLIHWDPYTPYDKAIGPARRKALFDAVPLEDANENVDRGRPFPDEVLALVHDYPDWADEIRLWEPLWIDMVTPEIPETVHLLRVLRAKGVPCYALSNFGRETFVIAEATYPFLAEFDKRFISAHLGVIKPDPEIYAALEAEVPETPETLLFTDDKPENIAAAAARGWQTHLFEDAEGFAERLVAAGLLTEEEATP